MNFQAALIFLTARGKNVFKDDFKDYTKRVVCSRILKEDLDIAVLLLGINEVRVDFNAVNANSFFVAFLEGDLIRRAAEYLFDLVFLPIVDLVRRDP